MAKADFFEIQRRFTQAIRQQQPYQPPPGSLAIEPRRVAVYQRLFLNTVSQFFASTYPVCHAVLGTQRWQSLMRDFLASHAASTPYFHFLGRELLTFLENRYAQETPDPPWLLALADWEWREMAVSIDTADAPPPLARVAPSGVYTLSPVAQLCAYDWPVHQVVPGKTLEAAPTFLLVWRDQTDAVHFAQLAPLMAALLDALDGASSIQAHLRYLAEACGRDVAQLWPLAAPFLQDLGRRGALCSA